MYIVDGVKWYKSGEVAQLVGRSRLTIQLWNKWSDAEEEAGRERFIPAPKILPNKYKVWSEEDVEKMIAFRDTMVRGSMAKYNKTLWTKKSEQQEAND